MTKFQQKGFILPVILIVVGIAVLGAAGYFVYRQYTSPQEPVVCTQDAKQCPNGTYVGRIGPNCEFAECPELEYSAYIKHVEGINSVTSEVHVKIGNEDKIVKIENCCVEGSGCGICPLPCQIENFSPTKKYVVEDCGTSPTRLVNVINIDTKKEYSFQSGSGYYWSGNDEITSGACKINIVTETKDCSSQVDEAVNQNQPTITVTSPYGGETWKIGEKQTIKYGTSNVGRAAICVDAYAVSSLGSKAPLSVGNYIFMTEDDGIIFTLGIGDSNDITPGDYKIQLDVHACAETNNTFVTSGTSTGYITVLSNPNFIKPSIAQISPTTGNKSNTITIYGSNLADVDVNGILMTPVNSDIGYTGYTSVVSKDSNYVTFVFISTHGDLPAGIYKVSVLSLTGESNQLNFNFLDQ